jgi:dynein heavy chain
MNSLLDDTKQLTLLDGNRISLNPLVCLIFEAEDLKEASPATVSRCGMVYLDVEKMNWDSLRLKWLLKKEMEGYDEESLDILEDLFDKWIEPILSAKKKGILKDVLPFPENSLVISFLKLLNSLCIKENGINYADKEKDELFWIKYEKWFTYSMIWSLGGTIHEDYRKVFDSLVRGIEDVFPLSQTVYDCYINVEKSEFVKWDEKLTIQPINWRPPKDKFVPKHRFLVETVETIRTRQMIETSLEEPHSAAADRSYGDGEDRYYEQLPIRPRRERVLVQYQSTYLHRLPR